MNLTLQELVILVIAIALIVSLIASLIKGSLRIAVAGLAILFLFSGFTWLPEKIAEWTGATTPIEPIVDKETSDNINETLNTVVDKGKEFVNDNKDSWIEAGKSLWNKLTDKQEEKEALSEKDKQVN